MKQGRTLNELAAHVSSLRNRIADFRANTAQVTMLHDASLRFEHRDGEVLVSPNELFHGQLADKLGIPQKYYDRLRAGKADDHDRRTLFQENVNHWLHTQPENRLIRSYRPENGGLFNAGRAFLSDRYRPLDNYGMMEALLPPLMGTGMEVRSCEVTDEKLYLQCVTPRLTAELKVGEPVNMGLLVSNSETGCGALNIQVLIYVCRCTNGMVIPADDTSFRKTHVDPFIGKSRQGQFRNFPLYLWSNPTYKGRLYFHILPKTSAWEIPSDVSSEYLDQLKATEIVKTTGADGQEEIEFKKAGPDHFADCELMGLVVADVGGLV